MTTASKCVLDDLSFRFIGSDIVDIDVYAGDNLHIAMVDDDGVVWYANQGSVEPSQVDIESIVRQNINISSGKPKVVEAEISQPLISSPFFNPRKYSVGKSDFDSSLLVRRRFRPDIIDPRQWEPVYGDDSLIPNIEAHFSIPVYLKDGRTMMIVQDHDFTIRVIEIQKRSREIISSIEGYVLHGASCYESDIVILASKIDVSYPKQSFKSDEFGGDTYSFWCNAPFLFILLDSESHEYFRTYSSDGETPFRTVSDVDRFSRRSSFDISDDGVVAVTSPVYDVESGVFRQGVSVCKRGERWSLMGENIHPFDKDVDCNLRSSVVVHRMWRCPVAYSIGSDGLFAAHFDYISSLWIPWRSDKFIPPESPLGSLYLVSYRGNGNTGGLKPPDQYGAYNSQINLQTNSGSLVKEGHSYSGWNTSSTGDGVDYAVGSNYTITQRKFVLYSKWTVNTYTISYSSNGATSGTVPAYQSGLYKSPIILRSNTGSLVKTGNIFGGWNTNANGSGVSYNEGASLNIPSSNMTLYAKWLTTYYVSYNSNGSTGGSVPSTQSGIQGSSVQIHQNTGSLIKSGYTFSGWNTQANGSGTNYQPEDDFLIPNSNVTMYAKWVANNYTVSFNGNGNDEGTAPLSQTAAYLSPITLPNQESLTKFENTFYKWNTLANGSGTDYSAGYSFPVPLNGIILYAKWTVNQYSVVYNGNNHTGGTVPSNQTAAYGSNVQVSSSSLFRTGYTFSGWNTQANGSGANYSSGHLITIPSGGVTLYAKWTVNSYSISYLGNGANQGSTPPPTHYGNYSTEVYLESNTGHFSRTGYTFLRWNTQASGSGTDYSEGAPFIVPAQNTSFYAIWEKNLYTITYDGNGSTGGTPPSSANVYYDSWSQISYNVNGLSKDGYTFANKWNTAQDGSGTQYTQGSTIRIVSNLYLYAQWNEIYYGVSYSNNGGAGTIPSIQTYLNVPVNLSNGSGFSRTGYSLSSWNTMSDGSGVNYSLGGSFTRVLYESLPLKAKWSVNTYTITYDGNGNAGGVVPSPQSSVYNSSITVANGSSLTKTSSGRSYVAYRWANGPNGESPYIAFGQNLLITASNKTLYADWVLNPVYISYNGNDSTGGSVPPTQSSSPFSSVTLQTNSGSLTKTGYIFNGWIDNASGNSYAAGAGYNPMGSDHVMRANWYPNTYTVTYNGNVSTGGTPPANQSVTNGNSVSVQNQNTLEKTGYYFSSWNTQSNGSGTSYSVGSLITVTNDVTLYARWISFDYDISYIGNGNTGGTAPSSYPGIGTYGQSATVSSSGTMVKSGYVFNEWNTESNGIGSIYNAGETLVFGVDPGYTSIGATTRMYFLYAQWIVPTYTVRFLGNNNQSGNPPSTITGGVYGTSITLPGNTGMMIRSGYMFNGWDLFVDYSNPGDNTPHWDWIPYNVGQSFTPVRQNIGEIVTDPDLFTFQARWVYIG